MLLIRMIQSVSGAEEVKNKVVSRRGAAHSRRIPYLWPDARVRRAGDIGETPGLRAMGHQTGRSGLALGSAPASKDTTLVFDFLHRIQHLNPSGNSMPIGENNGKQKPQRHTPRHLATDRAAEFQRPP